MEPAVLSSPRSSAFTSLALTRATPPSSSMSASSSRSRRITFSRIVVVMSLTSGRKSELQIFSLFPASCAVQRTFSRGAISRTPMFRT